MEKIGRLENGTEIKYCVIPRGQFSKFRPKIGRVNENDNKKISNLFRPMCSPIYIWM